MHRLTAMAFACALIVPLAACEMQQEEFVETPEAQEQPPADPTAPGTTEPGIQPAPPAQPGTAPMPQQPMEPGTDTTMQQRP